MKVSFEIVSDIVEQCFPFSYTDSSVVAHRAKNYWIELYFFIELRAVHWFTQQTSRWRLGSWSRVGLWHKCTEQYPRAEKPWTHLSISPRYSTTWAANCGSDADLPFPISTPIFESSRRSARPQLRVTSLRTGKKGRTSHSLRVSSSSSSCTAAWLTHSNIWLSISPRAGNNGNVWACFHKSCREEEFTVMQECFYVSIRLK